MERRIVKVGFMFACLWLPFRHLRVLKVESRLQPVLTKRVSGEFSFAQRSLHLSPKAHPGREYVLLNVGGKGNCVSSQW